MTETNLFQYLQKTFQLQKRNHLLMRLVFNFGKFQVFFATLLSQQKLFIIYEQYISLSNHHSSSVLAIMLSIEQKNNLSKLAILRLKNVNLSLTGCTLQLLLSNHIL